MCEPTAVWTSYHFNNYQTNNVNPLIRSMQNRTCGKKYNKVGANIDII